LLVELHRLKFLERKTGQRLHSSILESLQMQLSWHRFSPLFAWMSQQQELHSKVEESHPLLRVELAIPSTVPQSYSEPVLGPFALELRGNSMLLLAG